MEVLVIIDFTSREVDLVDVVKNICAEIGPRHNITWFNVNSLDMQACTKCLKCQPCGECVLPEDDAHKVSRKLFAADALVIGVNSSLKKLSRPFVDLLRRCINSVAFQNKKGTIRPWREGRPALILSYEKAECKTPRLTQGDDILHCPLLRILDAGGFELTGDLAECLGEYISPAIPPNIQVLEKRSETRLNAGVLVQVVQENESLFKEFCVNLSAGGLFLESEWPLPEDTPLALQFELPDSKFIDCKARVAWVNEPGSRVCQNLPPGMGIQFLDLRPENLEALRDFIKNKEIMPARQRSYGIPSSGLSPLYDDPDQE
jgi:uncharacterized protein (TIGR02266 family)